MSRRKRRPNPSEIRPGDELVAKLRKKLPKKKGLYATPEPLRGYPAIPRVLEEEESSPSFAAPMPRILCHPPTRAVPMPRGVSSYQPETPVKQVPPRPKTVGAPQLENTQRAVAKPPSIPQVLLPEGTPKPPAEETSPTPDAPICPLLGSKCLHEWCEWWDGISQCILPGLNAQVGQCVGRVQALQDWLTYRLGEHP